MEGGRFLVSLFVDEPGDLASRAWGYHPHVDPNMFVDPLTGVVGRQGRPGNLIRNDG